MEASEYQEIRQVFDDYLRMYTSRDDRLTAHFSDDFSGFTGGGDFLVKDRNEWVGITRQDFAQVKDPIQIQLKDLAIQSLAETIAVVTSFFTIHLPMRDHVLSRETARLVLIFRKESAGWKIAHSSISIPYGLVRKGEVYPLNELVDRNRYLEELISERTVQLSAANETLQRTNEVLAKEIAEHKAVEEALRKNKQQYDNLVSRIPVGIYISHSTPDKGFAFDYISPRMAEILNTSAERLLAHPRILIESLYPDEMDAFLELNNEGVQHRRAVDWKGRVVVEGTVKWLHLVSSPETLANGEVLWHGLVVDITERKQAEADKEKLAAQERQLQKTESLARMAGAIAHTFNNQLGVVMGNLELALMDLPQNAQAIHNLTAALEATGRAATVSGQMLIYLGQSVGKREPLDLAEVCRRSLPILKAAMPGQVVLETQLPAGGPVICADENQIKQVLTNLTTNAWEAVGSEGGTIHMAVKTVGMADIPVGRYYPVHWQAHEPAYACLELVDAGCGIALGDLENLFDPFFSRKFAGRGLGLAVVLGIVRAHGGAIMVESQPGEGSTFRVFLPIAAEPIGEPGDEPFQPVAIHRAGAVLLIEDEPMLRDIASAMLAHLGWTVFTARDGVEGLEVFQQRQSEICCVLCDLTMPRMNGWETLAALRQLAPEVPIILASGYDQSQVMEGDHPVWPQFFLAKPYTLESLRDSIGKVLIR